MPQKLLLVSSSRCHPGGYLDHCEDQLRRVFDGVGEVLFVPYARPGGCSHQEYSGTARKRFAKMGIGLGGIHECDDPSKAVAQADGVFIGGGNTFVLLRDMYENGLVEVLRKRLAEGMPYAGTSAGSNVAGLSVGTSNDMPIVYPPKFAAIGAVPFNINPHYPRENPDATHKGETRDDRIREFHFFNTQPVVALQEDGMLRIEGSNIELIGQRPALIFRRDQTPEQVPPGPMPDDLCL
jgi:dipeptidase E